MKKVFFGLQKITPHDKEQKIGTLFNQVASYYDVMNDVMSLGMHRMWKKLFISDIPLFSGARIVDCGGGTGDTAFLLLNKQSDVHIDVLDYSENMIERGKIKAQEKGINTIQWVQGDATALPYDNRIFDFYVTAFAMRNFSDLSLALHESYRVLTLGGYFYGLEFNHGIVPVRSSYRQYLKLLGHMGSVVANDRDSYEYLRESILTFPSSEKMLKKMRDVGYVNCRYHNLFGGIVNIHIGQKI